MVQFSDFIVHRHVYQSFFVLLYVGPDQALPLLSALGAIIGVLLMWWRRLVILTQRLFKSSNRKQSVTTKNSD